MSTTQTSPKLSGPATSPAPVSRPRNGDATDGAQPTVTRTRPREFVREHGFVVAITAALALGALSLLYPSTPSYDPWAWIQWGRDIVQLELNTDTGPSWKPFPVIFTTRVAPFRGDEPDLCVVVVR